MPSADYIARVQRDFTVLDSLPRDVRLLVHEYGARRVVDLYQRGHTARQIRNYLEDKRLLASL